MSRYNIGKMKIILGKEGFGVKVGEKKLFHFGSKSAPTGEGYADYPDDSDYAYENQDQYYPEDEAGYDEYDGYDNPDEGGYYDDRGDGYYADEDGYYQETGEERGGRVIEYIENNPWVIIALLVVLPPVGIALLWWLKRYEFPVRVGVSAVSAIWFIIALILIISAAVGGGEDPSKLPEMTLTTMAPTQTPTIEPVATATIEPETSVEPSVTPGATPLGGGSVGDDTGDAPTGGESDLTNVYSPQTGLYYHSVENCSNIDAGAQVTLVTREAAVNRNQAPCPLCYGGEVYYATADGRWYHTDRLCKGMDDAVEYSKEAAEKEGKTPCPTCAGGDDGSSENKTKKTKAQKYLDSITNDRSGVEVYWTANGKWFHTDDDCQNMKNAQKTTLLKAMQAGKTGCPVCFSDANKLVYCTSGGKSYHLDKNCQNMKNASQVTLAAAAVLGKSKCTVCVTEDFYNEPTPAPEVETPKGDGSTAYVYATEGGRYYHTNSACTDMKNAQKVTLLSMIKAGRPACPVCCSSASNTVYVVKNGKYYHSYATCSDMTNAQAGTLAQALAYGYKACYDCWSGNKPVDNDDGSDDKKDDKDDGNDGYSDVYIYASENGKYFHTRKSCSKADSDVSKVLLELAIDDGKTACPTCASEADDTVYAKKGGKYYHKDKTCQDITGMTAGTLAKALIKGYEACPVCYKNDDGDKDEKKYTPGESGINVYASASGKYYHTAKSCTAAKGTVVKVTLEAALNNGKSACTVCAASARRTVYATKSGKYYHYSSSCAGSSATSGRLDEALAVGFKACPNCVTGDKEDEKEKDKFEPGKSGIKVYAVTSGKYFHTKDTCGSMKDGTKITLEDALNYGLSACPNCAAAAAKKVYATEGSGTYHFDASCAGAKAVSGTRAEALALGMKACDKCVDKDDEDMPDPDDPDDPDDEDRSAPKDTKVYIDLSGKTNEFLYHTKAKCEGCGMTGGTAVTLKYALDQGFADCGHCNPPLSIAK